MRSRPTFARMHTGPPLPRCHAQNPQPKRPSLGSVGLQAVGCMGLFSCLIGTAGVQAVTLRVPQSYSTIQAGINAALPGDRVQVSSGTYREQLTLRSGVMVEGAGTVDAPVLVVGTGKGTVVTFEGVFDAGLKGVTLTGSGALSDDALIAISGASPSLENLVLQDGLALGIWVDGESYPTGTGIVLSSVVEGIHLTGGAGAHLTGLDLLDIEGTALRIEEGSFPELSDVRIERAGLGMTSLAGSAPVLSEFWILDSKTTGILLDGASAFIHDGQIQGSGGMGLHTLSGAQPNIQRLRIDGNVEGVVVESGSPIIAFCQLALNSRAAIVIRSRAYPAILHNLLQDNGVGIELTGSGGGDASPHIFNNTIVASQEYGIHCVDNAFPAIDNNIVTYHKKFGILCEGTSRPTLAYNLFYGNGGMTDGSFDYGGRCEAAATDISKDPLFVAFSDDGDPYNDDLHLQSESPAVDAGNPQAAYNDMDGTRNDMGAYGGPDFPSFIDMDGDAYTTDQGDCNDADPTVHPGAPELEDGVDNDCDGAIDEGTGGSTPGPETSPPDGTQGPGDTPTDGDGSPGPDGSGTPGIEYGEGCDCRHGDSQVPFRPGLLALTALAAWMLRRRASGRQVA